MARIGGVAQAHRWSRDPRRAAGRSVWRRRWGPRMARIHSIIPPSPTTGVPGAAMPGCRPRIGRSRDRRAALDARPGPRPMMEWGLRHLDRLRPPPGESCCATMISAPAITWWTTAGMTGVLDWEFAAWGDPHEDIGWLCAPCWRFGKRHARGWHRPVRPFRRRV